MNEEPAPTVGRIVMFRISEGVRAMYETNVADVCAAVVVCAWSDDLVNLRLLLDGPDTPWVTSVHKGSEPGQWSWPVRA